MSIALEQPVVTRHVGLITRRGRKLTPVAQQLYDFFDEVKKGAQAKTQRHARPQRQSTPTA